MFDLSVITATDTVILDTDVGTDCDDAAALALLFVNCKTVGANPVAVINDTSNPYGSAVIASIAAYYGYTPLIGQWEKPGFFDENSENACVYNRPVAERFPVDYVAEPATAVYRRVLEEAADGSVVIVTVGFLNAVAAIRREEPALFARKVRLVVTMAGNFETPSQPEWNMLGDAEGSRDFVAHCPCPLVFSGFEVGYTLVTGFEAPQENNPVSLAYQIHSGGQRYSWDPCTVDLAFTGTQNGWKLSEPVAVTVHEDGSLTVVPDPESRRYYVAFDGDAGKETIRLRINRILAAAPQQ